MVQQEENQNRMLWNRGSKDDNAVVFFTTHHDKTFTQAPHERASCTNYKTLGHEQSNSYDRVRYLARWGSRGRGRGRGSHRNRGGSSLIGGRRREAIETAHNLVPMFTVGEL